MRKLFAMVLVMMVAMAATAQTATFSIKVPELTKVAKINKSGVNLRKSPSAASPKLTNGMMYSNSGAGYHMEPGEFVPVIAEENGWLQISVYEVEYDSGRLKVAYPWIKGSFCTVSELSNLNAKFDPSTQEFNPMAATAPYKGLYFGGQLGGMDEPPYLFVGVMDGNAFYYKRYKSSVDGWHPEAGRGIKCDKDEYGSMNILYDRERMAQYTSPLTSGQILDFSKLSASQISDIVAFLNTENCNITAMTLTLPGKSYHTVWYFDWNKINFPSKTISIPAK